jgi:hypothetical protein
MEDVAPPAGFNPLAPALAGHYASNYTVVTGVEDPGLNVSADIDAGIVVGLPTVEGLKEDDLRRYLISKINLVDAGFVVDGLNPEPAKQYLLDMNGYLALKMLGQYDDNFVCTWVGQLPEEPGGVIHQLIQMQNYKALENTLQVLKEVLHLLPSTQPEVVSGL